MKKTKIIKISLLVLLIAAVTAKIGFDYMKSHRGGKIDSAVITIGTSSVYTRDEIGDAVDVLLDEFKQKENGCILSNVTYDEYLVSECGNDEAKKWGDDQAIFFSVSFYTDQYGVDETMPANEVISDWTWTLTRSDKGKWVFRERGFF